MVHASTGYPSMTADSRRFPFQSNQPYLETFNALQEPAAILAPLFSSCCHQQGARSMYLICYNARVDWGCCTAAFVVLVAAFARTKDPSEIIGADVVDEEVIHSGCLLPCMLSMTCICKRFRDKHV
jgi:hypothetical protein